MRLTDPIWWPRFARRCGVYLALLALTLQLAMSFGHIHARDFAAQNIAISKAHTAKSWHAPGKLADDDDHCPICFSGFLLGNSFVPHAAQPQRSPEFADARPALALTFDRVPGSERAAFQSRAPPLG